MKDILAEERSNVKKGQVIGLMGDTGRATGPHLDWRMELRGVRIDPYLLIKKIINFDPFHIISYSIFYESIAIVRENPLIQELK